MESGILTTCSRFLPTTASDTSAEYSEFSGRGWDAPAADAGWDAPAGDWDAPPAGDWQS